MGRQTIAECSQVRVAATDNASRLVFLVVLSITALVQAAELSITSEPYLTGGLFINPALPIEGEKISVTVRATLAGTLQFDPEAKLEILSRRTGKKVAEHRLFLQRGEGIAEATWNWTGHTNGMYTVRVQLDPNERVDDTDPTNNSAQIMVPVLARGRALHFPWYREEPNTRWVSCVTSANEPERQKRLAERGIKPLQWQFGGLNWYGNHYYDREAFAEDPEAYVSGPLVDTFYEMYKTPQPEHVAGWGIDETGGYPGSWQERFSMASMQALARVRKEDTNLFVAVWHGGGVRKETPQYFRDSVDLVLLESYVWRGFPEDLGTEDIYQMIRDRLDPFIRGSDMILPAYGNPCHTLIGIDLSERPDRTDLGEFEQVVRFIRRICPEMRGLCYYAHGDGHYGGYGLDPSPEMDLHHREILATADQLLFEYYINPCLTLMHESLWIRRTRGNEWELTAAVSNIGGIDSGPVTIEFYVNGEKAGIRSASRVPAGPNRNHNRALVKMPVKLDPGTHRLEARIINATGSTVLDPTIRCERFID